MSATYVEKGQVLHRSRTSRPGLAEGRPERATPLVDARQDPYGDPFHPDADGEHAAERRVRDLLTAQRLAAGPNGTRDLLRWLAHRTGAHMRIVDREGAVQHEAFGPTGRPATREVGERGETGHTIALGPMGERDAPEGTLHIVGRVTALDRTEGLLADAVPVLGWAWNAERTAAERARIAEAGARSRQAVLRLLSAGHTATARDVALAMGSPLPDVVSVLVVRFPEERRRGIERAVQGLAGAGIRWAPDLTWSDCLVLLIPVEGRAPTTSECRDAREQRPEAAHRVADRLAREFVDVLVGVGDAFALECTSVAYEQAAQALSRAPVGTDRVVAFGEHATPEELIGRAGAAWARRRLAPLRMYRPTRRADPGADELTTTLETWLRLGGRASRRLHVHRNTLIARLKTVAALLDVDLDALAVRAELSLALRILALHPGSGQDAAGTPGAAQAGAADEADHADGAVTVEELLAMPRVRVWARERVGPLGSRSHDVETLRTWLDCDARIEPTAAALAISAPGVRKRLVRIEERLGTGLIGCPATQVDLWLALKTGALGAIDTPTERHTATRS
ncbi:helix-turn-helix domain-containing protein [Embleya sp. NPDC050493]|uniref:helix-turn-helix domain-containing protein n=1 Tax=Embleya sp. NPDC050493 TaxID=3363989 RepID=UPI0037B7B49E